MRWPFKKLEKHPLDIALDGDEAAYGEFVRATIANLKQAERAHVLVAYTNLHNMFTVLKQKDRRDGLDFSIDREIRLLAEMHSNATDEVNLRRAAWLFWAALIYRLNELAKTSKISSEILGEIWCRVARSAPLLKSLLPENRVWDRTEKVFFDQVLNESEPAMIAYAVNYGPFASWHTEAVRSLAREFDFFYSEGTSRPLTYIPLRPPPDA